MAQDFNHSSSEVSFIMEILRDLKDRFTSLEAKFDGFVNNNCYVKEDDLEDKVELIIAKREERKLSNSSKRADLLNNLFNIAYKIIVVSGIIWVIIENMGV